MKDTDKKTMGFKAFSSSDFAILFVRAIQEQ